MSENENNRNNDREDGSQEDIKAFNWEWSDNDESSDTAESTESESEQEPAKNSEAETESGADDNTAENANEYTDNGAGDNADGKTTDEPYETDIKERAKKDRSLSVACIISACSIVLLVAFALSLMLGIFPVSGKETVILGISSDGATQPDTEATSELIEDFLNSVVVVNGNTATGTSTGTGVIISTDGYIVTNYHVIEGTKSVTVQLYGEDGAQKASVVGFHEDDDVAVIKIDKTGLRAAVFAESSTVRYGEKVYAVGNPEGAEFSWSVTQGIVSCPLRQLMIYDTDGTLQKKMNVVQTDASVNHGNSGGPLINVRGEVIGIVTLKRSDSAGMGFALPSSGVLVDVTSIIENGHADNVNSGISIPRPLLGITGVGVEGKKYYKNVTVNGQDQIEEVTEEYAKANPSNVFYAAVEGVYISQISQGSDAKSRLKTGDIMTEINGNPVYTIYDVMNIINKYNGGDKITVKYYRDGKYSTVELTLKTAKDMG